MRFAVPLMGNMKKEIDYQRTSLALGRPVDVEMLLNMLDGEVDAQAEREADLRQEVESLEGDRRVMMDAIDMANDAVNEVRTAFATEIIGKLNRIDRHVVSKVLKEQIDRLDKTQTALLKSKP